MLRKYLEIIEKELRKEFEGENTGHDIYHLIRTKNLALAIQEIEGGDREIIGVAALLHDVHRMLSNKTGRFVTPSDSLPEVKRYLNFIDMPQDKKERVLSCVEYHEEYSFGAEERRGFDLETFILQDADNLDAIGAIGVGRTFAYGGNSGVPMYEPTEPFERDTYSEMVADPSTVHHFYSKLLKLKDNMNTKTGRKIAAKRHAFLKQFLEEFFVEWEGRDLEIG